MIKFITSLVGLSFVLISFNYQPVLAIEYYWPRPESLYFFVPLNAENGLNNIAPNQEYRIYNGYSLLETSKPGPFGIQNSSYTCTTEDGILNYIASYASYPSSPSFTFSTYFYVSGEKPRKGGIFVLSSPLRFSVLYNGDSLEIHRFESDNFYSIGSFTVEHIFTNGWTFFSFTYENSTETVTVFNDFGSVIHVEHNFPILEGNLASIYLGKGTSETTFEDIVNGDAMACTMLYNAVLKNTEIAELPNVCKWKGKKPPPQEPWPADESLVGLWPLSSQYKFNTANQASKFKPVSFMDVFQILQVQD